MGEQRRYSKEYKAEAIKLSNKIGTKQAAEELGIPAGTLSAQPQRRCDDIDEATLSYAEVNRLDIAFIKAVKLLLTILFYAKKAEGI